MDFHQGTAGAFKGAGAGDQGPLNIADSDMPREPVSPASQAVIKQLQSAGVMVLPIAQNSAYLEVSFLGDSIISPVTLQLLSSLKDQLVSLKCSRTSLTDSALPVIGLCSRLCTRLRAADWSRLCRRGNRSGWSSTTSPDWNRSCSHRS